MDAEAVSINDVFDIRSPNEWMREAKKIPVPKLLFGELWQEGEIAIMFADTGKGKSVLAVQIADSIARGRPIKPFAMTAKPKPVLYLDFELSSKQFEMRYSSDHDPEKSEYLKNHFRFSEKFRRVELRPETLQKRDARPFEEVLRDLLQALMLEIGARVLIIDNITYLKRTAESTRESVPLMKELQRLKKRFGLSILVIAHTPKRDIARPLVVNDMQGSKVIANYADSIFAIGQSRRETGERYIKHVKIRSSELIFDRAHIPVFRLKKIGGNFLGLEFQRFAPELELLRDTGDKREWETIDTIKQMTDGGMSIRAVAAELQLSKSTAHRMLQMWQPPNEDEMEAGWSDDGVLLPKEDDEYDPTTNVYYFPGCEEYDDETDNPRFEDRFEREDKEGHLLRRKYYLIEAARARAHRIYKQTGVAPPLADDPEYSEFVESLLSGGKVAESTDALFDIEAAEVEDSDCKITDMEPSLKRSLDGYGREIFVESEDANGKPMVWYKVDSNGTKFRHERKGFAVIGERV